jgi:Recombination, repair and ssDNA binding protein UvsY.
MTIDEILEVYSEDAHIDPIDLGNEALKITKLFEKYIRLHAFENRELRKLESRYKQLYNLKCDWYMGTLNGTEELTKLGWEPQRKVILKPDLPRTVEGDRDVIKLTEIIGEQKDKVNLLKDIVKEVKDRSFNIARAVEVMKFNAGSF